MRNFKKEQADHDARVSRANAKVEAMERLVAGMHPSHYGPSAARHPLDQMRQNACEAEMNRAIFRYDEAASAGRDGT